MVTVPRGDRPVHSQQLSAAWEAGRTSPASGAPAQRLTSCSGWCVTWHVSFDVLAASLRTLHEWCGQSLIQHKENMGGTMIFELGGTRGQGGGHRGQTKIVVYRTFN